MMLFSKLRFTIFLIAACALSACASSPNTVKSAEPAGAGAPSLECPDVTRLHAAQLYGSWQVELVQAGLRGQLTLSQHPEFKASLRGHFSYGGERSLASGDVEDGEFNLDESRDGKTLFAFWSGRLVPSACGAEIRGKWQALAREGQPAPAESDFILRRAIGGW
ncbi:hypothetical protein [Ottowia testudinis]|uniref:Lipocalin-like domain-containing protein n=1 Tax=Ottowia testudinis TaxID=2816950 RepID=A0A975CLX7_9BURK|nr:hypothetical protein [Ottowia testudinis]QTD45913.1 hypothetical protein J1M35_03075 [Ottowia testudinis]